MRLGRLAEDLVIEGEEPYPPDYTLVVPNRVLRAILDGEVGWEEALLSLRLGFIATPTFSTRGSWAFSDTATNRRSAAHDPGAVRRRDDRARRLAPPAVLPARERGPVLRDDLRRGDRVPPPPLEVGHRDG